jgi:hypothetical protein
VWRKKEGGTGRERECFVLRQTDGGRGGRGRERGGREGGGERAKEKDVFAVERESRGGRER